jgi:hypothetical protein
MHLLTDEIENCTPRTHCERINTNGIKRLNSVQIISLLSSKETCTRTNNRLLFEEFSFCWLPHGCVVGWYFQGAIEGEEGEYQGGQSWKRQG